MLSLKKRPNRAVSLHPPGLDHLLLGDLQRSSLKIAFFGVSDSVEVLQQHPQTMPEARQGAAETTMRIGLTTYGPSIFKLDKFTAHDFALVELLMLEPRVSTANFVERIGPGLIPVRR